MKCKPLLLCLLLSTTALCASQDVSSPAPFGGLSLNPDDGLASFNANFSRDGRTVYFSRATTGWTTIHIYVAHYSNGAWPKPKRADFSLDGARYTDPYLSRDGTIMYFASDRAMQGEKYEPFGYRIWQMKKVGNDWSAPVLADEAINRLAPVLFVSFDGDGNAYFIRSGKERGLYVAKRESDGSLGEAVPLAIPGAHAPLDPIVSSDGKHLYFIDSPTPDSKERYVYLSVQGDSGWSPPRKLPESINVSDKQIATGLSPDDAVLFYASKAVGNLPRESSLQIRCHALEGIVDGVGPSTIESLRECRN